MNGSFIMHVDSNKQHKKWHPCISPVIAMGSGRVWEGAGGSSDMQWEVEVNGGSETSKKGCIQLMWCRAWSRRVQWGANKWLGEREGVSNIKMVFMWLTCATWSESLLTFATGSFKGIMLASAVSIGDKWCSPMVVTCADISWEASVNGVQCRAWLKLAPGYTILYSNSIGLDCKQSC